MKRRNFLKAGAVLGAASVVSNSLLSSVAAGAETLDMAVVQGADYFQNSLKAVEALGGMGRFLQHGGVVGILPNASFRNPGTYTSPDVVLAVITMCYAAGVKEIRYLGREMRHLSRSPHFEELRDAMSLVTFPSRVTSELDIPQGKTLKRAEVLNAFQECKAFINLPVLKHHEGTNFSCALKNMMGILSSDSCQFFHFGSGGGWYDDIDFLSQCIADLNLLKKPALIVADATECLSSNGPFGPGDLIRPQRVIAAADPVLVDAYTCTLMGLEATNVAMIGKAVEYGLGNMDLQSAAIQEIVL